MGIGRMFLIFEMNPTTGNVAMARGVWGEIQFHVNFAGEKDSVHCSEVQTFRPQVSGLGGSICGWPWVTPVSYILDTVLDGSPLEQAWNRIQLSSLQKSYTHDLNGLCSEMTRSCDNESIALEEMNGGMLSSIEIPSITAHVRTFTIRKGRLDVSNESEKILV